MPKGGILYLIMVFAPREAIIRYNVLSPMGVFVLGGIYRKKNESFSTYFIYLEWAYFLFFQGRPDITVGQISPNLWKDAERLDKSAKFCCRPCN